jgi:hypothetical protein
MAALKESVLRDIATNICKTSTKGCGRGKKGVADLVSHAVASGQVAKAATKAPKPAAVATATKTRSRNRNRKRTRSRSKSRSSTQTKKKA